MGNCSCRADSKMRIRAQLNELLESGEQCEWVSDSRQGQSDDGIDFVYNNSEGGRNYLFSYSKDAQGRLTVDHAIEVDEHNARPDIILLMLEQLDSHSSRIEEGDEDVLEFIEKICDQVARVKASATP